MKLIDRVLTLDPEGGRYGLGVIRAEADIHPDDWFLTCHFVDDKVMPGTLMYECCAHTLRVFLLRMGWVSDRDAAAWEPVIGVASVLKCRGPVTPETRKVVYDIEIKEIGYGPEPFALADAHMFADDRRVVFFRDMSMKLTGLKRDDIEAFWRRREAGKGGALSAASAADATESRLPLFDRRDLVEFAVGSPSRAFGRAYRPFDRQRFIARLPGPPFLLISRIVSSEAPAWVLRPGGWIEAEVDLAPDDWYFRAEGSGALPFGILLETALQPCGWLAAYAGSALKSAQDLKFRNLGGTAVLKREILAEKRTLSVRARMTQVSEAADMILESFEFQVADGGEIVYEGTTHFGFFTPRALEQEVGIRGTEGTAYQLDPAELAQALRHHFTDEPPLAPDDPVADGTDPSPSCGLKMPSKALRMIDHIDAYLPEGGPAGLGFVRGCKRVDPDEWYFKAHFFQDPVCPGSLGIESFLQLIKFAALQQWPDRVDRCRFGACPGTAHTWRYRGQILPQNDMVTVEASITRREESPTPALMADGILQIDGRTIYKMENFGIRLAPLQKGRTF
jgi:3-hydroxymyristoyl/3-hydroxydecanoyl-(acyl carrier protein) dehydratase